MTIENSAAHLVVGGEHQPREGAGQPQRDDEDDGDRRAGGEQPQP